MILPSYRYLAYYFVISEIEFLVVVKDNYTVLQKKGWIANSNRLNVKCLVELEILTSVLRAKILNEIYGLKNNQALFDQYCIQLSMHNNIQKSLSWYKEFYANPYIILEYIKNNIQFMVIHPKICPNKFEKTFEIVRLDIRFYTDYDFSIKFWFQNIEDASECYSREIHFDQHRKKAKILAYALAWHNRQLEKKKE